MNTQSAFAPFHLVLYGMLVVTSTGSGWAASDCIRVLPAVAGGAFVQTGQRVDGYYLDGNTAVDYFGGRWVILGNDGRLVSSVDPTDPAGWRDHLSHTSQNLHDMIGTPDGGFVAVGNNGMLLQAVESRPRITSFRAVANGVELESHTSTPGTSVDLQASNDLGTWQTIATNIGSPYRITSASGALRFFQLAAP